MTKRISRKSNQINLIPFKVGLEDAFSITEGEDWFVDDPRDFHLTYNPTIVGELLDHPPPIHIMPEIEEPEEEEIAVPAIPRRPIKKKIRRLIKPRLLRKTKEPSNYKFTPAAKAPLFESTLPIIPEIDEVISVLEDPLPSLPVTSSKIISQVPSSVSNPLPKPSPMITEKIPRPLINTIKTPKNLSVSQLPTPMVTEKIPPPITNTVNVPTPMPQYIKPTKKPYITMDNIALVNQAFDVKYRQSLDEAIPMVIDRPTTRKKAQSEKNIPYRPTTKTSTRGRKTILDLPSNYEIPKRARNNTFTDLPTATAVIADVILSPITEVTATTKPHPGGGTKRRVEDTVEWDTPDSLIHEELKHPKLHKAKQSDGISPNIAEGLVRASRNVRKPYLPASFLLPPYEPPNFIVQNGEAPPVPPVDIMNEVLPPQILMDEVLPNEFHMEDVAPDRKRKIWDNKPSAKYKPFRQRKKHSERAVFKEAPLIKKTPKPSYLPYRLELPIISPEKPIVSSPLIPQPAKELLRYYKNEAEFTDKKITYSPLRRAEIMGDFIPVKKIKALFAEKSKTEGDTPEPLPLYKGQHSPWFETVFSNDLGTYGHQTWLGNTYPVIKTDKNNEKRFNKQVKEHLRRGKLNQVVIPEILKPSEAVPIIIQPAKVRPHFQTFYQHSEKEKNRIRQTEDKQHQTIYQNPIQQFIPPLDITTFTSFPENKVIPKIHTTRATTQRKRTLRTAADVIHGTLEIEKPRKKVMRETSVIFSGEKVPISQYGYSEDYRVVGDKILPKPQNSNRKSNYRNPSGKVVRIADLPPQINSPGEIVSSSIAGKRARSRSIGGIRKNKPF